MERDNKLDTGNHYSKIIEKNEKIKMNCNHGYCKDIISLAMSKGTLVANTVFIIKCQSQ